VSASEVKTFQVMPAVSKSSEGPRLQRPQNEKSDKTGVHAVADKAVTARITATLTLLVMRDINVLHSSLCPPGSSGAGSAASGGKQRYRSRLRTEV
jgi:hypothetical protein